MKIFVFSGKSLDVSFLPVIEKLPLYLCVILVFIYGCTKDVIIRKDRIYTEFDKIIRDINRNSSYLFELKNRRLSLSGYFYVIDSGGRIVYHPEEALIGMNFKDNPFVKRLLKKRNGCIEQLIEGRKRVIIFKYIDGYRILCLSISSSEIELNGLNCEYLE